MSAIWERLVADESTADSNNPQSSASLSSADSATSSNSNNNNNMNSGNSAIHDHKHSTHSHQLHNHRKQKNTPPPSNTNMADKLVDRLVSSALPTALSQTSVDERLKRQKARPPFSVPVMSRNFRRFNSRMGVMFEIYYFSMDVLSWEQPSLTLSTLSIYSFTCLNPHLLLVLPVAYLLFGIMVPAYMIRHPPEPSTLDQNPIPAKGPALKSPDLPRPVPEMSREFYLNIVDTQNSMYDYSVLYDNISSFLSDFAFFQNDESRSSSVFTILTLVLSVLLALGPFIYEYTPWKAVFLVTGWVILGTTYPLSQTSSKVKNDLQSRLTEKYQNYISNFDNISTMEFQNIEPHEQRQVEIFELQPYDSEIGQWMNSIYYHSPYAISVSRNDFTTPHGATSLLDVLPPKEWAFVIDHWQRDYSPENWVSERGLGRVCDIDFDEKWVYDKVDGYRTNKWRRRRWVRICSRTS